MLRKGGGDDLLKDALILDGTKTTAGSKNLISKTGRINCEGHLIVCLEGASFNRGNVICLGVFTPEEKKRGWGGVKEGPELTW